MSTHMQVCRFNKELHAHTLFDILIKQDHPIPSPNEFPEYGYIAIDKDLPVAIAFLRRVEGGYAQIDGLCSNPEASPAQRHEALDSVISKVIDTAKELGIHRLVCFTKDQSVCERSKKYNFKPLPHVLIVKEL